MPVWDLFVQDTTVSTLQQEGVRAGMTDLLTGRGEPRVWPPQGCQQDRPQDRRHRLGAHCGARSRNWSALNSSQSRAGFLKINKKKKKKCYSATRSAKKQFERKATLVSGGQECWHKFWKREPTTRKLKEWCFGDLFCFFSLWKFAYQVGFWTSYVNISAIIASGPDY